MLKPEAVGAADSLKTFMETPLAHPQRGEAELASTDPVTIEAEELFITSPEGKTLYWTAELYFASRPTCGVGWSQRFR